MFEAKPRRTEEWRPAYKNIDFMNRTNRGATCKGYLKGYEEKEEAVSCSEEEKSGKIFLHFFSFGLSFHDRL